MRELFSNMNFENLDNENSIIIHSDCLTTLKSIKNGCIDLIFADPPYNLGKDFGNNSDNWDDRKEYFDWCYKWIDECFRVLKPDGTFYLMNSTQNIPYISVYLQENYLYFK